MIHKIFAWLLYLIKILIYKGWKMDKENERVRVLADKLKALTYPARLYMVKKHYLHGECNISYFVDCMPMSQSSIS